MSLSRISKIVIANRGEIACRVQRTATRLGLETVAVYSEADRTALHVRLANEAHYIGPAASQQSYLRAEKLLEVALKTNAQAIHPGYGFLSENVEFAVLCKENNIIFIGPPESAIRDMGIKNTSKAIMESAGVPIIQGYHGEDQDKTTLLNEAKKIGFPVMIKAIRGGGGKGMRIAMTENDFIEQLESAKRESLKSFNDDNVLLEKFIETPRHVEVQIFGDSHGNYVHLCERDCSVQRRHQKIIEEAPGPHITPEIRQKIGEAAVKAASAVKYVGAGTVEFIMDAFNKFYFMEMNTRLQVEHPITEMITGFDLVEWQLRIAAGEKLPVLDQALIFPRGHAFEARIYAEDCSNPEGFMPTAGRIVHMKVPSSKDDLNIRIDTGVVEGDEISVHYDPMIAKLIVWSHDRSSALQKLNLALRSYQIVGLPTNIEFLQSLAKNPFFIDGHVHTDFIKQHKAELFPKNPIKSLDFCVAGAVIAMIDQKCSIKNDQNEDRFSPFHYGLTGFRVNSNFFKRIKLKRDSVEAEVSIEQNFDNNSFNASSSLDCDKKLTISGELSQDGSQMQIRLNIDGVFSNFSVYKNDLEIHVFENGQHHVYYQDVSKLSLAGSTTFGLDSDDSNYKFGISPMPGVIEKILVSVGQNVKKGEILLKMMAMKMEYSIRAGCDGNVSHIKVSEGETVAKNINLIELSSME